MKRAALVFTLMSFLAPNAHAESDPGPTKAAEKTQKKDVPKKRRRTKSKAAARATLVKTVLRSLPKGWRLRTKGLPAKMAGLATGPDGETIVVSQLEQPIEDLALGQDARTWLLGRLGAARGTVEPAGAFGSFEVRGVVAGPDRRDRALRAWVVPGNPAWLVSWVGPADRAARAEQSAAAAARRWAGS